MNSESRSFTIVAIAFLALALSTCANSLERDGWSESNRIHAKYPCDVFSFNFCFRRPYGVVVSLESGPDFDIFRVINAEGNPAFSMYVGTTPERESEQATRLLSVRRGMIDLTVSTAKVPSGRDELDVRVYYETGLKLHIFGASNEVDKDLLIDVMQSFRHCRKEGFTSVACEAELLFDEEIIGAMRDR